MNRIKHILVAALSMLPVAAVIFAVSCASPGGSSRAAYVQVGASGIMRLNGTPVSVDKLGAALKRKGYGQRSPINVHYVEPMSDRMRITIITALRRSGFNRVAFIGPKTISTDVSNKRALNP